MLKEKTYLGAKFSVYYTPLNTLDETGFSTAAGSNLTIGSNSIRTSIKPLYNIDAVLGYEIYPHFLPFVEGGVTFAEVSQNYVFKRTRTNVGTGSNVGYQYFLNLNNYNTGFNVGVGLNYEPHKHWIFSTELVYNNLGKNSGSVTTAIPASTVTETQSRSINSSDVALFGSVSYLF